MTGAVSIALKGRLGGFGLDVAIEVPTGGITALFGPSGCGKTSVLRCVAGLERLSGRIEVGADVWQDEVRFVPPHRRAVGYVFQEAGLFPHLSVKDNLLYGSRRVGSDAPTIRLDEMVDLLGLAHLIGRDPARLSGGERQRVSIGRALLSQPRLLLMDEPLSALDRIAKDEILPYFEALHAQLSIPILYVTHDLAEVERLADHLVLMEGGCVVASGPLAEVLTRSRSPLLARREVASVLAGRVLRVEADGLAVLEVAGAELLVVAGPFRAGDAARLRIAAADVSIARTAAADTSILNALDARVTEIEPQGEAEILVRLAIGPRGDGEILSRISRRSLDRLALKRGEIVVAQVKGVSLLASR